MFVCMYAMLGQVIIATYIPIFTNEFGDNDEPEHFDMLKVQFCGVAAIVENIMAEVLKETRQDEKVGKALFAMLSTITLKMTFFKVIASLVELSGRSPSPRTSSTSCGLSSSPSTRLTSC